MDKERIYVIGHKNPDTDSICSAIALAELMRAGGAENVRAARAGDVNPQTAFILDRLGVEPPVYLPDVHPRARDVMSREVVKVDEDAPLHRVMELMRDERVRFIPVLGPGGVPKGVLTIMDLARRFIVKMEAEGSRDVTTTLENITSTLGAETVLDFMSPEPQRYSVYVGAMKEESFIRTIREKDPASCIVVVGDRPEIQMSSVELGVGLLVVSGGFSADADVVERARSSGVSLIISPFDSATTALMVRLSTPAMRICTGEFERAAPDDLVEDLRFGLSRADGLVVMDDEGVMQGVVTKSSLLKPPSTGLILVDHNELSQAVDGADRVEILEVIDHHRIGNFQSSQAIPFTCDPVGSTSTLVAERYRRSGRDIDGKIAGLLLGGVLSDTVMLRSPTTTPRDHEIVVWLEEKSGLAHKKFGTEIFSATSSLRQRGPAQVVRGDHKVFEAKGRKFGIGQVETIGFDEFTEELASLEKELKKIGREKGLALSALLVTDIVYGTSLLLAVGEKEVMHSLGYPKVEDGVYELKNVISRKKQVVPHILGVFDEAY